jgi:deoxyribose-phosphate aldolase
MTYIEYAIYDLDYSDIEFKKNVTEAINLGVNCLSVPVTYNRVCKSLIKDKNIVLSNAVDYPLGIMDTESRKTTIENHIKNGAQKIDIVVQNNLLNLKKYDKIKLDIEENLSVCKKYNVPLYYYLEYRVFTHQSLIKICELLSVYGINNVYISTGYMLDNPEDNLIALSLIKSKSQINVIFTANLWTNKQLETIKKSKINLFRTSSIETIRLLKYL